jgi:hypothetical protein
MAKQTITFSLDVEAAGPIPGLWWMCSLGICRTDDVHAGWSALLKPMVLPGVSQPDEVGALQVVAKGLKDLRWDPALSPEANARAVRSYFERNGCEPREALLELREWLLRQAGTHRAVIVGSPVTYDFMWLYWYWWHFLKEMPPFGFSGLDVRSYFMGMHGVDFLGTGKERYLKHYPNEYAHTHDPLDDARQQGRIWNDMVAERRSWKKP